jgi:acyl CoA:acetate/3-ketoacid CoA transferase
VADGTQVADGTPTNGPALELIEIAPGIDLEKDVLDQIEFEVAVSPDLKLMDERIFTDGPMGLTID